MEVVQIQHDSARCPWSSGCGGRPQSGGRGAYASGVRRCSDMCVIVAQAHVPIVAKKSATQCSQETYATTPTLMAVLPEWRALLRSRPTECNRHAYAMHYVVNRVPTLTTRSICACGCLGPWLCMVAGQPFKRCALARTGAARPCSWCPPRCVCAFVCACACGSVCACFTYRLCGRVGGWVGGWEGGGGWKW